MTVTENMQMGAFARNDVEGIEADLERMFTVFPRLKERARQLAGTLSGGEQQMLAMARAMMSRPKLLLLDEPLGALDRKLREHTQFELVNLQERLGITFVMVTHDQEEAMTLSTRIAVMNEGRLEQVGTPGEVYEYPANRFVADFVGNVNLLQATVAEASADALVLDCPDVGGRLAAEAGAGDRPAPGDSRWVALRPEKIVISKEPPAAEGRTVLRGTVHDLGYFGNLSVYRVELPTGRMLQVSGQNRVRTARKTVEWDDEVFVYWDNRSAIVLQD